MCQGCLLYSILGTCWWNILCHLRLAWHCCTPCEVKLLESCWDWLTVPFGSCSPHSPPCRHSSVPGILQPCSWWQVPQLDVLKTHQAFLPFSLDAFRFIPWPKPVAFASSQIVWEELCTSARPAAVYCSMFLQAAQGVWWDVLIEAHLPSSSSALLCLPEYVVFLHREHLIPTAAKLQSSPYLWWLKLPPTSSMRFSITLQRAHALL